MKRAEEVVLYTGVALAAGAFGLLLGRLTAPASGRATRRLWRRRAERGLDSLRHRGERALDDLGHDVTARIQRGKKAVSAAIGA